MKKNSFARAGYAILSASLLVATVNSVRATPIFADNFDSYTAGNLVGQGPWLQTGTVATFPVQVTAGNQVSLGTSGQDVYAPTTPLTTIADGTSLYIGLDLDVTTATATGDYFLHFTPTVGNTSGFYDKLFVKSSGSGFVLGWLGSSGGTTPYGTTVLNFGTTYRVVLAYNAVSGTLNDTGAIYVNPTDLSNPAGNTAYLTSGWTGTGAENENVAGINFRQGTATTAPALLADNLDVSQTFSDTSTYTPIPEPSSLALLGGFGILAWHLIRRRR